MTTTSSLRAQALSLYRSALRMTHLLPYPQLRSKTRYNIRLLYSIYKDESDPLKLKEILENGAYDVETFRMVCKVNDGEIAKELFKPFEPVFKDKDKDNAVHDDGDKSSLMTKEERGLIEELVGITNTIGGDIQSVMIDASHTSLHNK
jgi:hypothetical protein